jgi:peptidyl-prolyl cis-trans isomerase-like protein 2
MLQTGDTNGKGGKSFYDKEFKDEFNTRLMHGARGILSMANHGPGTNTSQFFITFKACRHLDRKHTVFGKVKGGGEYLDVIEKIPTGAKDVPEMDLVIQDIVVTIDPFEDYMNGKDMKKVKKSGLGRSEVKEVARDSKRGAGQEIGKYLASEGGEKRGVEEEHVVERKVKKAKPGGFGNFDGW